MARFRFIGADGPIDLRVTIDGKKRPVRVNTGETFSCEVHDWAANNPRLFEAAEAGQAPKPDSLEDAIAIWVVLSSKSYADAKAMFEDNTGVDARGRGWVKLHEAFVTWAGFEVPLDPSEEDAGDDSEATAAAPEPPPAPTFDAPEDAGDAGESSEDTADGEDGLDTAPAGAGLQ